MTSMLRDVEYFQSRLSKMDGFEDAGDHLANIVKSREVKPPAAPPAPPTPSEPPSEPVAPPTPASEPLAPAESLASPPATSPMPTPQPSEGSSAELRAQIGE